MKFEIFLRGVDQLDAQAKPFVVQGLRKDEDDDQQAGCDIKRRGDDERIEDGVFRGGE